MIYKFFDTDSLDEAATAKYYPLLSDTRKKIIASMPSAKERSIAFCSEIIARQCLNEMFHAPDFSFKLLLSPNGKSAVGNFDAQLSLAECNGLLGCVVSRKNVGMTLLTADWFSFNELQKLLTDTELRDVFSYSRYTYTELLTKQSLDEKNVCIRAATYLALKHSYFKTKGQILNRNFLAVEFSVSQNEITCSDPAVIAENADYIENKNIVYAVTEER